MIAEQYRNIKPHFAGGKISPVAFRWRCILLDQDTENPPFEPCRYFVVNVFAETRDQVIDCLGEEYPWCDIMVADRAIGLNSDDEFLESWLEYHDNVEQQPLREAPHGKEYPRKFNHLYDIAFSVISNEEDGGDITGAMVREAILKRLEEATDDDLMEGIGYCDTYEEEQE
jgi:hypothetical protein